MRLIRLVVVTGMLAIVPFACKSGSTEADLESCQEIDLRAAEARTQMTARIEHMKDNALIRDLSLANIHFVPHTDELNSLGQYRLQRYAELLQDRGGTLALDSASTDEALNKARLQSMSNFLASAGISKSRIVVQMGMREGRGIAAVEAIEVKEAAYAPERERLTDLIGESGGFAPGGS